MISVIHVQLSTLQQRSTRILGYKNEPWSFWIMCVTGSIAVNKSTDSRSIDCRHFTAYVPTVGRQCSDKSADSMPTQCQPISVRQSPTSRHDTKMADFEYFRVLSVFL